MIENTLSSYITPLKKHLSCANIKVSIFFWILDCVNTPNTPQLDMVSVKRIEDNANVSTYVKQTLFRSSANLVFFTRLFLSVDYHSKHTTSSAPKLFFF